VNWTIKKLSNGKMMILILTLRRVSQVHFFNNK
jgi:hypothetical protein